jgi:hypothetical protein
MLSIASGVSILAMIGVFDPAREIRRRRPATS